MTYGEKRRVVSFNLDKQEERELYEFASSVNFTSLVKRFLSVELKRRKGVIPSPDASSIAARLE